MMSEKRASQPDEPRQADRGGSGVPGQGAASSRADFESAAEEERVGLLAEFWDFLKYNKKWWLLPIVIALVALIGMGLLFAYGGGAAAPFIYPMF